MKDTNKIWIKDVAEICAAKNMRHAVISPGSRSAPLVIAFSNHPGITCYTIVDERAAGFYALGMAQQTDIPVALICTSGSALLNYAPAIAEAYYQKIPLLVFSADRPDELVDQRDGQTIRQNNIYANYIKKSFKLPVNCYDNDDRWFANRITCEAINIATSPHYGPVHVNVPLRDPLYDLTEYDTYQVPKIIDQKIGLSQLSNQEIDALNNSWAKAKNKLIIAGSNSRCNDLTANLNKFKSDSSVVLLTETTSNLQTGFAIPCIDATLESIPIDDIGEYIPDLLITFGGDIVSKKIKAFLRNYKPTQHWHIDETGDHIDTFKSLTEVVKLSPKYFFEVIESGENESTFRKKWKKGYHQGINLRDDVLNNTPYCDFKVFEKLISSLPHSCNLHLANSTPVRYSNLFELKPGFNISVNCNRGTSGIDGTISTAAGAALTNNQLTIVITGDLSFLYDSNALWVRHLRANLKIVVINNSGGNIFRIIPGPSKLDSLEDHFEAHHDISFEHLAKAYQIPYYFCDSSEGLSKELEHFFTPSEKASILEIKTPSELSAQVLGDYMNMQKTNNGQ